MTEKEDEVANGNPAKGEAFQFGKEVVLSVQDSIAWIRLGPSNEKLAILSEQKMSSLDFALDECLRVAGLRGIIFTGSTAAGFCGGADVNVIERVQSAEEGARLAGRGQAIFSKIERFPVPTVAAVYGACVGGGCELSLACSYRVAIEWTGPDGTASGSPLKIGLPEVKLGILPGFGGTQRLPRLVGLPKALEIILQGKTLDAKRAKACGLIDQIARIRIQTGAAGSDAGGPNAGGSDTGLLETVSLETAVQEVRSLLTAGKLNRHYQLPLTDRLFSSTGLGRKLVKSKARASVLKETQGRYPAPLRALDVTVGSLESRVRQDPSSGYAEEATALGQLVVTPECKSLVHIFKASEGASKLGRAVSLDARTRRVAVVGSGVMGSGIAASFLANGFPVVLLDSDSSQVERARARIEAGLARRKSLSAEMRAHYLEQLVTTSDTERCRDAQLVVEAIVEDLDSKRKLFAAFESLLSPEAILATNTSSLSVAELAEGLAHPGRLIGLHFFNPAEKMPLVELIRTTHTDERTLLAGAAFVGSLGKFPVVVEDVAGFLVNRILTPYLSEATSLLAEGYSVEEIDRAAVSFGMPMGPLRLLDEVGLDVGAKVAHVLQHAYGERMAGPPFAERLLGAGLKGKKSGEGFYLYSAGSEVPNPRLRELLAPPLRPERGVRDARIEERLIFSMVHEALRCFVEGVAGTPSSEAAAQVDLASVMGTGFAPFRGGILHYVRTIGLARVVETLADLHRLTGASQGSKPSSARFQTLPALVEHQRDAHSSLLAVLDR